MCNVSLLARAIQTEWHKNEYQQWKTVHSWKYAVKSWKMNPTVKEKPMEKKVLDWSCLTLVLCMAVFSGSGLVRGAKAQLVQVYSYQSSRVQLWSDILGRNKTILLLQTKSWILKEHNATLIFSIFNLFAAAEALFVSSITRCLCREG